MYCNNCFNLLTSFFHNSVLKHKCNACGSIFDIEGVNTLVYADQTNEVFDMKKSGKTIYYYPCNQKIELDCPSCDEHITAWERDYRDNKVYGCKCGYSWH